MTRKNYCGNLLWQSSLTLLAQPINFSRRDSWLRRAHEALAVPQGLVRSMADFSTDPAVLYRWRDEMADLIEEALEK